MSVTNIYTENTNYNNNDDDDDDEDEIYCKRQKLSKTLHIAVAGCSHGEMDRIYETLEQLQLKRHMKFDFLICCGDFQAIRNSGDLHHISVPSKYRQLMSFYKYYSGEKTPSILTIFVGGNHESSGFLSELPNGGWVAPNIYYMGYSSVIQIGGLRIAGLSGIFKSQDYNKGHYERPPFKGGNLLKSIYHVRSVDIFRLKQLKSRDDEDSKIDVVVTHDWPAGITDYGDVETLLKIKPYFSEDIKNNQLGNPATMDLLHELKPRKWFSAHMHVKFVAEVLHHDKDGSTTKFLALDKPLRGRKYLECFEVPLNEEQQRRYDETEGLINDSKSDGLNLFYDPIWLAILKNTDFLTQATDKRVYMPGTTSSPGDRFDFRPTKAEVEHVKTLFNNNFVIPRNFRQTAPPQKNPSNIRANESFYYRNPQSQEFCEKLGIIDLNYLLCQKTSNYLGVPYYCEIFIDQKKTDNNINRNEEKKNAKKENKGIFIKNPEEIDLSLDETTNDEFGNNFFVIDATPQ